MGLSYDLTYPLALGYTNAEFVIRNRYDATQKLSRTNLPVTFSLVEAHAGARIQDQSDLESVLARRREDRRPLPRHGIQPPVRVVPLRGGWSRPSAQPHRHADVGGGGDVAAVVAVGDESPGHFAGERHPASSQGQSHTKAERAVEPAVAL